MPTLRFEHGGIDLLSNTLLLDLGGAPYDILKVSQLFRNNANSLYKFPYLPPWHFYHFFKPNTENEYQLLNWPMTNINRYLNKKGLI